MLVEANLQAIVNSEIAPIEERLRFLVVDIIRRCQSTVAQNFQQLKESPSLSKDATSLPSDAAAPTPTFEELDTTLDCSHTNRATAAAATMHYREPPFLDFDVNPTPPLEIPYSSQGQVSDSAYGSNNSPCDCSCHTGIGSSKSTNGMIAESPLNSRG